jgi:hypothetical protein
MAHGIDSGGHDCYCHLCRIGRLTLVSCRSPRDRLCWVLDPVIGVGDVIHFSEWTPGDMGEWSTAVYHLIQDTAQRPDITRVG